MNAQVKKTDSRVQKTLIGQVRWLAAFPVMVAAILVMHSDETPAGAYTFAGETHGTNLVTYPRGYDGTGGTITNTVCIVPGSPNAAAMETPLQNAIRTWNRRRAVKNNLLFGADNDIPSSAIDWESAALHELGHCIGLAHVNLATESGLPSADRDYTKSTDGAGAFDLGAGADGVKGSSDDLRGDDENMHWFRTSDNNPLKLGTILDFTTYSRSTADLPSGHTYVANSDRTANVLLGESSTEGVMQQGQFFDEDQRQCVADGVATLALAETGLDRVSGTADDYDLVLEYGGISSDSGCEINVSFNNAETGFAVCKSSAFISSNVSARLASANVFFNTGSTWHFNDTENNLVWHDENADGVQDSLEPGLQDVLVRLRATADNSVVATTVTDKFGRFGFSTVADGTYRVQVVRRAGFRFSRQDQGGSDDKDSDVDVASGFSDIVTVTSGAFSAAIDAGMSNGMLATVSSLNGNASDEKAVVLFDELLQRSVAHVKDGSNGAAVRTVNLASAFTPLQIMSVPDYDSNGEDELAVLSYRPSDGAYAVEIRNAFSRTLIRRVGFRSDYKPVDFAVVPDMNSNGAPEMALLGIRDTSGGVLVQIRDGLTGAKISHIGFSSKIDPIAMTVMPSFGGTAAPELAVVGLLDSGAVRARVRDASSRALLEKVNFSQSYVPVDIVAIDNTSAGVVDNLAVLGYRGDTERSRVEIRDTVTGALLRRLVLTGQVQGLFLEVIPDGSDAGSNQEVVVVGNRLSNPVDIRARMEVFDALATAPQLTSNFSTDFHLLGTSISDTLNGGSDVEVDVLGINPTTLQVSTETRDSNSGATQTSIDFP